MRTGRNIFTREYLNSQWQITLRASGHLQHSGRFRESTRTALQDRTLRATSPSGTDKARLTFPSSCTYYRPARCNCMNTGVYARLFPTFFSFYLSPWVGGPWSRQLSPTHATTYFPTRFATKKQAISSEQWTENVFEIELIIQGTIEFELNEIFFRDILWRSILFHEFKDDT